MVAFTGDGSLTMMMGEFATLAQHKLPVKVVVMKNNTLGLIKWEQMLYLGNPEYGVDLHPVDFVKVAEALRAARLPHRGPALAAAISCARHRHGGAGADRMRGRSAGAALAAGHHHRRAEEARRRQWPVVRSTGRRSA